MGAGISSGGKQAGDESGIKTSLEAFGGGYG
jgi:hypothetical protein